MGLGLNYSNGGGSGDIVPYVKFDARAGRFFRNDRTESNGAYSNNPVDITSSFKAVVDLENIEVGYMKFGAGTAPEYMLVTLGTPMPQKPADPGFKQGARIMMKLASSCGGDVREITGNAAAFLKGVDDLHTAYEAGKAANPGKLPIVILQSTLPIKSGQGQKTSTNYQPVFEIQGWAPRPADLVFAPKNSTQQIASSSAPATAPAQQGQSAPATGSTPVGPPAASKQLETADSDFG